MNADLLFELLAGAWLSEKVRAQPSQCRVEHFSQLVGVCCEQKRRLAEIGVALKRELPHGPPIMMRRLNQNATVELGQTGESRFLAW